MAIGKAAIATAKHCASAEGLAKSFELLGSTSNEAAVGVLIAALDAADPRIQESALRAILVRRSPAAEREVLKRLHVAGDRWRAVIEDMPGRMTNALRDAILGTDFQQCDNACQAILWLREYDLVPALVAALEDSSNPHAALAARTLRSLAKDLAEHGLAGRHDQMVADAQLVRQHVAGSLESSVKRYSRHQREEVIHAFLLLARRNNETLRQILLDTAHPCHACVSGCLAGENQQEVIQLLASFVSDPLAPPAVLDLLRRRGDLPFIQHLLGTICHETAPAAAQNLRRAGTPTWLRPDLALLDALNDAAQHGLVQLNLAGDKDAEELFTLLEYLLVQGKPGGRLAAARALAQLQDPRAKPLALRALADPDPRVRTAIASQLRQRGVPSALVRLIEVDSPHAPVPKANRAPLTTHTGETGR